MRTIIRIGFSFILIGCAASLKEIKSTDQNTYVYGYAEISGASRFQINLRNLADDKRYTYTKNWMSVPFMTKEILFAFQIDPGKWQLESVVASKGGQMVIPTGPRYVFEVSEGKGNYMGSVKSVINPFESIINVDNNQRNEGKVEVDAKMIGEFPNFDSANTVIIGFHKE